MKNENRDITIDFIQIKRIVREYYEQLYAKQIR